MNELTRRDFLNISLAGAAAAGSAALASSCSRASRKPTTTWSNVRGANEDIRMGIVGIRSQGRGHIDRFRQIPGVRVTALCDADSDILDREVKRFTDRKEKVEAYVDYRRMLDDPNVDAVAIATPNHWHSLMAIWACQAGKDVKVEKPVSHNVWEGRQMVEAARLYNRVVQAGTESRSDVALQEVFQEIQNGSLGKILVARGFCYKRRESIGKVAVPSKIPPSVNYHLWAGPAPMEPVMRRQFHYDWHWVWNTGNGDIGNQGAHEMDMCRWVLGQDQLPPRVLSVGGRFGYDDDGETANTQIAIYDYKPAPLIFEVRGLPQKTGVKAMDTYRDVRVGVVVECEHGYFAGGAGGGKTYDNDGKQIKQYSSVGGRDHSANFIKAVRSRNNSDLNAHIPEGHLSAALCHLGNISHRVGLESLPGDLHEALQYNAAANGSLGRFTEHLAANGVHLEKTRATLGPWLQVDPVKEKFVGFSSAARRANRLLTRKYRKPFVVPNLE